MQYGKLTSLILSHRFLFVNETDSAVAVEMLFHPVAVSFEVSESNSKGLLKPYVVMLDNLHYIHTISITTCCYHSYKNIQLFSPCSYKRKSLKIEKYK